MRYSFSWIQLKVNLKARSSATHNRTLTRAVCDGKPITTHTMTSLLGVSASPSCIPPKKAPHLSTGRLSIVKLSTQKTHRRRRPIKPAMPSNAMAPGAGTATVLTERYPGSWRVDSLPFFQSPSDEYGGPCVLVG